MSAIYLASLTIISIHALLTEGDSGSRPRRPSRCNFNPRPPHGGRHINPGKLRELRKISIHALLTEGDFVAGLIDWPGEISIHALLTEGDRCGVND